MQVIGPICVRDHNLPTPRLAHEPEIFKVSVYCKSYDSYVHQLQESLHTNCK